MASKQSFNLPPALREFRRSRDGILLGVFRGIAEKKSWNVFWTRVVGAIVLLGLSGMFTSDAGLSRLLLAAFFYLILAVILPLEEPRADEATLQGDFGSPRQRSWAEWTGWKCESQPSADEPFAVRRGTSLRVPSSRLGTELPRGDLAELAARLERLSRRVQRIEGVVTGPEYDWERRLRS